MATAKAETAGSGGNGNDDSVQEVQGWRPNPGDEIEGKIVDVSEATSTQRNAQGEYPTYPLLKIDRSNGEGEVFVHAFHQTLQRALLERRPQIGHRIRIKFMGKQQLKSDSTRSVAVYSLETPDTPKTASNIYDRIERNKGRGQRQAPQVEPDVPIDDDFDF